MNRRQIATLFAGDFRSITRDSTLLLAAGAPVLIIPLVRFGMPLLQSFVAARLAFDISPYYPLLHSLLLLVSPLLFGTVVGFILIDDRDEGVLEYFSVTPISKTGYLRYRLASPVLLATFFALLISIATGLSPIELHKVFFIAIMAACEAPVYALYLGAFAANKVEAFALSKAAGIFLAAPLVGFFVKSPWQYLAGISPTFWVSKSFLAATAQDGIPFAGALAIGFAVHIIYIWLLGYLFSRRQG